MGANGTVSAHVAGSWLERSESRREIAADRPLTVVRIDNNLHGALRSRRTAGGGTLAALTVGRAGNGTANGHGGPAS
jgi:hypothetical protein